MVPFEDYVSARGGELLRLARALAGNEKLARDLLSGALIDGRADWARIAEENPDAHLRQGIVRGYLSPWRRSAAGSAEDPLAVLSRPQRAVLVLRFLVGLSYLDIAEHLDGAPGTAAKLVDQALAVVPQAEVVAALDSYPSASPGTSVLLKGAATAARHRSRRRVLITSSVLAVLVAIGTLVKPTSEPAPQPSPTPTAINTYQPSPVRMVPAIIAMPVFPYQATYLPADAGSPTVHQEGATIGVTYQNFAVSAGPTKPASDIHYPVDYTWERDGRWLRLVSDRISLAEADRVAAGLVPGETRMPLPPFTISLMPVGYVVRRANPKSICLAARQEQPSAGLCVTALPDVMYQAADSVQPVTVSVQGRVAHLFYSNDLWAQLWIHLDGGDIIRVSLAEHTPMEMLNKDDLLTFAEAIRIGP